MDLMKTLPAWMLSTALAPHGSVRFLPYALVATERAHFHAHRTVIPLLLIRPL